MKEVNEEAMRVRGETRKGRRVNRRREDKKGSRMRSKKRLSGSSVSCGIDCVEISQWVTGKEE